MTTRRKFLKNTGALGAASLVAPSLLAPGTAAAQSVTALINPKQLAKFVTEVPNPLGPGFVFSANAPAAFTLNMQQITGSIGLITNKAPAPGLPTTVWGYNVNGTGATYPGKTFEILPDASGVRHPIQVTYTNNIGAYLPGVPIDTTLDWANTGNAGATAPVPLITHLHGGDTAVTFDGLPDDWFTQSLTQRGPGFVTNTYTYDNQQEAGHLWYHDHALGVTRNNVYMGLAGNYFIRDANEQALRAAGVLPSFPYEVPLVFQDRQFLSTGQLFYPATGQGNLPNPTHLPEFFGDVILVNGKAWPKMTVSKTKYRLRLLNGSDSRFYEMSIVGAAGPLPITVIGTELGLLNTPAAPLTTLRLGPGERYDVIVDFTGLATGATFTVLNTAGSPYPNGAKPAQNLTDRLMQIVVSNAALVAGAVGNVGPTTNLRPANPLPAPNPAAATATRRILLFEGTDPLGRLMTMLGPVDPAGGVQGTLFFKDPPTETPAIGTTEIWEFYNTTVDAHPLHLHLVDFRVLDRQAFTGTVQPKLMTGGYNGGTLLPASIAKTPGTLVPAPDWESGRKDTVTMFPGQVTRILMSFNRPGKYVYHCHILSHEDHEMMRPYEVR